MITSKASQQKECSRISVDLFKTLRKSEAESRIQLKLPYLHHPVKELWENQGSISTQYCVKESISHTRAASVLHDNVSPGRTGIKSPGRALRAFRGTPLTGG